MSDDLYYSVKAFAPDDSEYDVSKRVAELALTQSEREPDVLTVKLADPHKTLSDALKNGVEIEVDLGTHRDHSLMFRGKIHRVDANLPKDGVPSISLKAYDLTMALGVRPRRRLHPETSLKPLVTKLGEEADFSAVKVDLGVGSDPKLGSGGTRQHDETDLAFLRRLSDLYGCVMYAKPSEDGDTLMFVAESVIMAQEARVALVHGRCDIKHRLLSFEPSADVARIPRPRVHSGIDRKTGSPVRAEAKPTARKPLKDPHSDENLAAFRKTDKDGAEALAKFTAATANLADELKAMFGELDRVSHPTFVSEEEAKDLAAVTHDTQLYGMQARGRTPGSKDLQARSLVEIVDVGGGFSGFWFLSQVRHNLNRDGHTVEFQCRR